MMASTKTEIPLAGGEATAEALENLLGDICERILVVGSVRRGKPIVHDVELLLEPKTETNIIDLFGTTENVSLFEKRYEATVAAGMFAPIIGGYRLKRFLFREIPCELFIMIPPSQWGMGMVIRTGPADFSRRLVTPQSQGGWLPNGMYVKDLCIHAPTSDVIETPTEEDVFAVLGREYIAPGARS